MFDIIIIGSGPAGLSAAIAAKVRNKSVLVIGNGIETSALYKAEKVNNYPGMRGMNGREILEAFYMHAKELGAEMLTGRVQQIMSMGEGFTVACGQEIFEAKTIILAMGCREKPRGAISIPGSRCSGIFSAGTAQELVNMHGYQVGKEVVILGSGDIGLIMARRLTYEGARVKCVVELMPYSSGLKRNIVQCLDDYDIPLKFSSTVTNIVGKERLEGVYIAQVDENKKPIKETEEFIPCDTLLLSVGLVPENELSKSAGVQLSDITGGAIVDSNMQTSVPGLFSCGNVLHIHDLVDNVTLEAYETAEHAVEYLKQSQSAKTGKEKGRTIPVISDHGIRYVVPQYLDSSDQSESLDLKFRSSDVYKFTSVSILADDMIVKTFKKRIMTPGEMEKVTLKGDDLERLKQANKVCVMIGGE